ncbi:MAG: DUF2164 family protein [bacterium]
MTTKKNRFEFSSEDLKRKYLNDIIAFFQDIRGEEIGFLAAEEVLDFFTETMGEEIYRMAIKDSKKLLKERLEDIDIELDLLSPEKTQKSNKAL